MMIMKRFFFTTIFFIHPCRFASGKQGKSDSDSPGKDNQ